MERKSIYLWIAGGAAALMLLFIFLGPDEKRDDDKSVLWDEAWSAIEYHRPRSSEGAGAGETATTAADKLYLHVRLIREQGLLKDAYYVETPAGGVPGAELVRRRGNHNVKNTMRDWSSPELKAAYEATDERLARAGVEPDGERARFFLDPDGEPAAELRRGKEQGGDVFLVSTYPEHRDGLLITQGFLFDRLEYDYLQYRERRLVEIASGSYVERIEATWRAPGEGVDGAGESRSVVLTQKRSEEELEGGGTQTRIQWFRGEVDTGVELPQSMGNQIDGLLRQLQIDRFRDEPELAEAPAAELWQTVGRDAGAELELRIRLYEFDETIVVRMRRPPDGSVTPPSAPDEVQPPRPLVLLDSSVSSGVDWTLESRRENLAQQLELARSFTPATPAPAESTTPSPLQPGASSP